MPESFTLTRSQRPSGLDVTSTSPATGVNFMALFRRFCSTCERRNLSPFITAPGVILSYFSSTPLVLAFISMDGIRSSTSAPKVNGARAIVSLPASIIATSVRSETSMLSLSTAETMLALTFFCLSVSTLLAKSSL